MFYFQVLQFITVINLRYFFLINFIIIFLSYSFLSLNINFHFLNHLFIDRFVFKAHLIFKTLIHFIIKDIKFYFQVLLFFIIAHLQYYFLVNFITLFLSYSLFSLNSYSHFLNYLSIKINLFWFLLVVNYYL